MAYDMFAGARRGGGGGSSSPSTSSASVGVDQGTARIFGSGNAKLLNAFGVRVNQRTLGNVVKNVGGVAKLLALL